MNISQKLLHVGFCNLVQVLWIICCFMWKRTRFLLLILPLISSFSFHSNFITLFCKAYKDETWYTHGQRVDLLCTPNTSIQNILVPLFFFFFVSFQLAKIKNLLLQNCFNIPLMATAGVCELCSLSAILCLRLSAKKLMMSSKVSLYQDTWVYDTWYFTIISPWPAYFM